VTLEHLLEGLSANRDLSATRRRDLRSAVSCFAALTNSTPSLIPLDLGAIRSVLDLMVPIQAKVSRKRWANMRSDLAAAIAASGLRPMINTHFAELNQSWLSLFSGAGDPSLRYGLSRFARWASERQIGPAEVNEAVLDRFIADLESGSLVRKIPVLRQDIVRSWNAFAKILPNAQLQPIPVRKRGDSPPRSPWSELPDTFRKDVDEYLDWASVPDPLDENARSKALAPRTVILRRDHIHSAVTAAVAAGLSGDQLVNLKYLAKPEVFKKILRHRWDGENRKLTAYTHGVAGSLIAIATEWVKAPDDQLMELKKIRRKLGSMKFGMTDKNKAFLRKFDDRQMLRRLLNLPDKLWRQLTIDLKTSRHGFDECRRRVV
jgi:hypothetical protein